jgi:hypothetical protein
VRGIDFNSFKPNLLASGSTESEILIWDLVHYISSCLCECMYTHTCMHTWVCTHLHVHLHTFMCAHYACTHSNVYALCMHAHIQTCTHLYANTPIFLHVQMCMLTYICIHTRMHTHTHTHTQTHTHTLTITVTYQPLIQRHAHTHTHTHTHTQANPNTPNVYTPGTPTQPLSDINCVAWNGKVIFL